MTNPIQQHSEHLQHQLPASYDSYQVLMGIAGQSPISQTHFEREFEDTLDRWQEVGGAVDYIQYQQVGSFVLTATPTIEIPGNVLVPAVAERLGVDPADRMVEPPFMSYSPAYEDPDEDPFIAGAFADSTYAEQPGYSPAQITDLGYVSPVRFSLIDSQPDPSLQAFTLQNQTNLINERAAHAPKAGHHSPRPLETMAYWMSLAKRSLPLNAETTTVPHLSMKSFEAGQVPISAIKDGWIGPELQMVHTPDNSSYINRLALG